MPTVGTAAAADLRQSVPLLCLRMRLVVAAPGAVALAAAAGWERSGSAAGILQLLLLLHA
jgi:hypothetical protein